MKKFFVFVIGLLSIINFSSEAKMSLPFEDAARKKVLEFLYDYKIEKIEDINFLVRNSTIARYVCIGSTTFFGFLTLLYVIRSVKRAIFEENEQSSKSSILRSVLSTVIPGILTTGSLFGYSFSTILYDYSAPAETVQHFQKFIANGIASLAKILKK